LKIHGKDLTGITPRKAKPATDGKDADPKVSTAEEAGSGAPDAYVSATQQQLFKTLFLEYYKGLEAHLIRDHKV
jgi:regulator of nonsense transcripts 2